MAKLLFFVLLAQSLATVRATEMSAMSRGNPIRKVVTMLQNMAKKVEAEGEKEVELYDKFMCYCKTGGGDLTKSIADANTKIPDLESSIEASASKKTQFEKELADHEADRKAAGTAMAEATSVREKEAASFKKEAEEDKAEAAQMSGALKAMEAGVEGAFLQTPAAAGLRKAIMKRQDMEDSDRQTVIAFLSGSAQDGSTSPVIGILKQMQDESSKGLAEAEANEKEAEATFGSLMAAKKKEVKASTKMIEEKLQRVGQLATEIESLKNELEDTKDCLAEDKKMLSTLEKSCSTKEAEFKKAQELRQQELVALSDTIKVLNDDDALELFKKTLPGGSASFVQIQVSSKAVRARALRALRSGRRSVHLDFIALALRGKKAGFEGVITMIDKLSKTLAEEQAADDKKKAYCGKEFDKSADKKKGLERSISDTESAIGKAKEDVVSLGEAIEKLMAGIKELDKSVAEATKQRKDEHAEYSSMMANSGTAKELLGFAKNRLNKFYNPKMYKAPPKRQLSEEDSIVVGMGGTVAPTAAGGIAGTGIGAASFMQVQAHSAAPSEESNGVIAMINLLIGDLDKEMTEAETTEKDSQADYEEAMKDAAAKRATDSKALAESESEKADLESSLQELTAAKKSSTKELMATEKYIVALHSDCDWLLQYFDVRKQARASELDSLGKAKDVLSGADYSFLQVASSKARHFLGSQ